MNWFLQWRYRRRLEWCKKNNVLHYALVEAGKGPTEVMNWPKKKLLWMRDIDNYLTRSESKLFKYIEREVREQLKTSIERTKNVSRSI